MYVIESSELSKLPLDMTIGELLHGMLGSSKYLEATSLKRAISSIDDPGFSHSAYLQVCKTIDDMGHCDVAPVVRGEWIKTEDDTKTRPNRRCSVCGHNPLFYYPQFMRNDLHFFDSDVRHGNYCPVCGAKMNLP